MILGRHLRRFRRDERGVALVELSLLFPVLMTLCFGMVEFSRVFYQFHVANKGVKAAARYVARVVNFQECTPDLAAFGGTVTEAQTLAIYGGFDTSASPSLSNWSSLSDVTVARTCEPNAAVGGVRPWRGQNENLSVITVSTSFTYNDLGLLGAIGLGDITISATHQEIGG